MRSGVKDRKPPYAEPLVRWCERSVNTKVGDKHLRLVFTSYSIEIYFKLSAVLVPIFWAHSRFNVKTTFVNTLLFHYVSNLPWRDVPTSWGQI